MGACVLLYKLICCGHVCYESVSSHSDAGIWQEIPMVVWQDVLIVIDDTWQTIPQVLTVMPIQD
jgi:hypothetical protein